MKQSDKGRSSRFVMALILGGILGAVAGTAIRNARTPEGSLRARVFPGNLDAETSPEAQQAAWESSAAWQYVRAMREQQWDFVVDHTLWMRERLERVQLESGAAAVAGARQELIDNLKNRSDSGNHLRVSGIDDQYVLSPFAMVAPVASDAGAENLEAPVAERLWVRAEFSNRLMAPRDPDGLAIRALTAGVNVSAEGYVLKANIIGNLDIQQDSVSYDWEPATGE